MAGEDSLLTLFLKVEGGQASAAEILDLKARLESLDKGVNDSQANLQEKFSHKFEHIALKSFLADGARSIGIGGELRPVLSAVQMGLIGVEEAMGPWILGLIALSGLLYKVYEHTTKHNEGLDEALKKYQEAAASVDDYVAAGGRLTDALNAVAKQQREAAAETLKSIVASNQAKLAEDQQKLAVAQNTEAYLKRSAARNNDTLGLESAAKKTKGAADAVARDTAELEANTKGYANRDAMLKGETERLKQKADAQKKAADEAKKAAAVEDKAAADELHAFDILNAAGQEAIAKRKQYADEEKALTDDMVQRRIAEGRAWMDREIAQENKHYQEKLTALEKYNVGTEQLTAAHQAVLDQITRTGNARIQFELSQLPGQTGHYWREMKNVAIDASNAISAGFGHAFAKTLIEGKSFNEQMKALSRDVAEQIIADLIRVQVQALITRAVLDPLGLTTAVK